jgi:hypothetical protein
LLETQRTSSLKWKVLLLVLGSAFSAFDAAQNPVTRLITQPIDEPKVVTLHGNVHPLAQARYDAGAAPSSMPARRMLLLLNRPADREA